MTLTVKPQREPFAPDPPPPSPSLIVRGNAYNRFYSALEKYCLGRSSGRSFVVSGHRGVGKTTTVLAVVEDLFAEAQRRELSPKGGDYLRRPLLVSLSGPDIIREQLRRRRTQPNSKHSTEPTASAEPEDPSDTLLRQLARALQISLAREFARCYKRMIETRPGGDRPDLLEAAAQLGLELNAGAKAHTLRRFWELAECLDRGILIEDPGGIGDQGLRELVALDVSGEAYRIATGNLALESSQTVCDRDREHKVSWAEELRSLVAPATSFLGAAATGFGVFHLTSEPGLVRTLTSIAAALVSAMVLTFGLAPRRYRRDQSTVVFNPDTSVGSLSWRLADIIKLLFDAGLAPVFVVDELDKVTHHIDLGNWIGERARELKSLLTEKGFFCFLTARGYAEKIHRDRHDERYGVAHTQFSDAILVHHLPGELHDYLRDIITREPNDADESMTETEERTEAILPFLVMFDSEMHPIDIRRQLNARFASGDVLQRLDPLPLRERLALMFQVAIESVLVDPAIENRMRDDPRFSLLVTDAVYYSARKWQRNEVLDISQKAIEDYLTKPRAAASREKVPRDEAPSELTRAEAAQLGQCARNVVSLIRSPPDVRARATEEWIKRRLGGPSEHPSVIQRRARLLVEALPSAIEGILDPTQDASKFDWVFDAHGRTVMTADTERRMKDCVRTFAQLRDEVDSPLRKEFGFGLDSMATDFALIYARIRWARATEIWTRLATDAADAVGPDTAASIRELAEYIHIVQQGLPPLLQLAVLTTYSRASDLQRGLALAADALQLAKFPNEQRITRVASALSSLEATLGYRLTPPEGPFVERLRAGLGSARTRPGPAPELVAERHWQIWMSRLLDRIRGGHRPIPGLG